MAQFQNMKKHVYFFLIPIFCLLAISCSLQRKERISTFDPDFDTFDPGTRYRLWYSLDISVCDNEWITVSRPSFVTLPQDAEINIHVTDDTITHIQVLKGHFRYPIQRIPQFNLPEFNFRFSDFICDEKYQQYAASITLQIDSKKGGTAFISFLSKDNDKSNICD